MLDNRSLTWNIETWNIEKKPIIVDDSKVEEDLEEPGDKRSMVEMRKMANSICPILQLTEDYPSRNPDGNYLFST